MSISHLTRALQRESVHERPPQTRRVPTIVAAREPRCEADDFCRCDQSQLESGVSIVRPFRRRRTTFGDTSRRYLNGTSDVPRHVLPPSSPSRSSGPGLSSSPSPFSSAGPALPRPSACGASQTSHSSASSAVGTGSVSASSPPRPLCTCCAAQRSRRHCIFR